MTFMEYIVLFGHLWCDARGPSGCGAYITENHGWAILEDVCGVWLMGNKAAPSNYLGTYNTTMTIVRGTCRIDRIHNLVRSIGRLYRLLLHLSHAISATSIYSLLRT
jgi:hypothetical protein